MSEGGRHLLGISTSDDGLGLRMRVPESADFVLDLAHGIAGDGRQHDGAAKGNAARVVACVVEARRKAGAAMIQGSRHVEAVLANRGLRESFQTLVNEWLPSSRP